MNILHTNILVRLGNLFRITQFLDFVHHPVFKQIKTTQHSGNWICSCPEVRDGRHLLCLIRQKQLTSVTGSDLGNGYNFWNIVLVSFLEYFRLNAVQTLSNPECYRPSSELFTVYFRISSLTTPTNVYINEGHRLFSKTYLAEPFKTNWIRIFPSTRYNGSISSF